MNEPRIETRTNEQGVLSVAIFDPATGAQLCQILSTPAGLTLWSGEALRIGQNLRGDLEAADRIVGEILRAPNMAEAMERAKDARTPEQALDGLRAVGKEFERQVEAAKGNPLVADALENFRRLSSMPGFYRLDWLGVYQFLTVQALFDGPVDGGPTV